MTGTAERPSSVTSPPLTDLRLKDILDTLPRECFHKDGRKAWGSVLLSVAAVAAGYAAIALSPWYLLPLAWIFTGTALTGFFVIAHDCGHRSFARRLWVNDLVGHLLMLPLIYPFHSWRLLHDRHHLHTNKLEVDNAWQPWQPETYTQAEGWLQAMYRATRGWLWWLASIAHWATLHFDPSQVSERDRDKVKLSVVVVAIGVAIGFPLLIVTTGWWGFVKFWLLPWLVYHFWMSTFTLVHHTDPDIPFRFPADWHEVEAQLAGTVHCDYPRWVEVLCHDINVHIPHHLSVGIPSYNLRLAHHSLKQTWGSHMRHSRFSLALMREIVGRCHLYHPERNYQSFAEYHKTAQ